MITDVTSLLMTVNKPLSAVLWLVPLAVVVVVGLASHDRV